MSITSLDRKTDPFEAKYEERKRGRERGREKEMRNESYSCVRLAAPEMFLDASEEAGGSRQASCPTAATEESHCVLSTLQREQEQSEAAGDQT